MSKDYEEYCKKQASRRLYDIRDYIGEIEKYISSLESEIDYLKVENARLMKDAKGLVDNRLIEENKRLLKQLEMSFGQFDSEKELKAYNAFCEEHRHLKKEIYKAAGIGHENPYVKMNGNGIGTCKTVVCPICGKEQDITDISVW